jgi:hypothetical protein
LLSCSSEKEDRSEKNEEEGARSGYDGYDCYNRKTTGAVIFQREMDLAITDTKC